MHRPSKGTVEAEIANAVVRFQRDQQGRGPVEVRAHIIGEMVLVRSKGIFTATEERLAASDEGRKLIRSARQELRSINHLEIEEIVGRLVGSPVVRSFYDVDVVSAEQIEIFVLESDVEKQFPRT